MIQSSLRILTVAIVFTLGLQGCNSPKVISPYSSESLTIKQLTPSTFLHTSYLNTEKWGKVPCNGMVVISNGEALVFDTPVNPPDATELLNWIKDTLECKTVGVIATHFHIDCLGSLEVFHEKSIPSYANNLTIELAKADSVTIPQNGFETTLELAVGTKKVINTFHGQGHTKDNVVSYFPNEQVLFGGCLVKEVGAGKGNLADANVAAWPTTIGKLISSYGDAKIVIPGHGAPGGTDLLDFTKQLYETTAIKE